MSDMSAAIRCRGKQERNPHRTNNRRKEGGEGRRKRRRASRRRRRRPLLEGAGVYIYNEHICICVYAFYLVTSEGKSSVPCLSMHCDVYHGQKEGREATGRKHETASKAAAPWRRGSRQNHHKKKPAERDHKAWPCMPATAVTAPPTPHIVAMDLFCCRNAENVNGHRSTAPCSLMRRDLYASMQCRACG